MRIFIYLVLISIFLIQPLLSANPNPCRTIAKAISTCKFVPEQCQENKMFLISKLNGRVNLNKAEVIIFKGKNRNFVPIELRVEEESKTFNYHVVVLFENKIFDISKRDPMVPEDVNTYFKSLKQLNPGLEFRAVRMTANDYQRDQSHRLPDTIMILLLRHGKPLDSIINFQEGN